MELSKSLDKTIQRLRDHFGIGISFDMIGKEIRVGERRGYLLMVDGFAKDDMMLFVTTTLQKHKFDEGSIVDLIRNHIAYMEAEESKSFEQIEKMVLSGAIALFVDGFDTAVIIDARTYPVRSSSEPELEKVTRGPRDGFVETVIFNTALIRRRVRDPKLRFELKQVGKRSKTDVAVSYIDDLVDPAYVKEIVEKLAGFDVDSLTMAEKTLSEILVKRSRFNPLPQVRFTERPDVAAAHLLEGHILLIVDTSPSVIILPTTIFHFTQHVEDYYQTPVVGTYLRWVRFGIMITSFLLVPIWLLAIEYPGILPQSLEFLIPEETGHIPIVLQLFLLEIGIDILRLSSIHTPSSLTTPLGIVSGLILGDLAVSVGWLIPETVLYMAIVGVGTFATPSIEFAMAIRIFRLYMLLLTGIFHLAGFIIGISLVFVLVLTTKNISRESYLWPLVPFDGKALKHILFRGPIPNMRYKSEQGQKQK